MMIPASAKIPGPSGQFFNAFDSTGISYTAFSSSVTAAAAPSTSAAHTSYTAVFEKTSPAASRNAANLYLNFICISSKTS
nr:MAG: hypothetical protein [Bacteriophage sp.]